MENIGSSDSGAFDISLKDNLPSDLEIPSAGPGLNLQVFRGNGDTVGYTILGGGTPADFFVSGIELTDDASGAARVSHGTNGENVIIIFFTS